MRIVVGYPPDFSVPTAPFGALPLFSACLRRAGHEVLPLDLAAITFERLIRRENLEQFYRYADAQADPAARAGIATWLSIPREDVLGAEQAARELRDPAVYFDPPRMRAAWRRVFAAVELLSSQRRRLDPRNADFARDLYAHLAASPVDPWVESYEALLRERLTAFAPTLVALTIPYSVQMVAAMKFAGWIHRSLPGCKVVAGGTGLSDHEDVVGDPRLFDSFDFVAVGDGEEALPELAARLEEGGDLADVPGLFRRVEGTVVPPRRREFAEMDASPTPDFAGIDFGLYLAPEKIASLSTSRGCYYGKCTFCPESFRLRFRRRASPLVWQDVRHIAREQGITNFMFWDPLTPPGMLTEISERSAAEGVEIHWMAQVKFEHLYTDPEYVRTLARGGCEYLQFGFESAVQPVLDAMDKGNDMAEVDVILDRLQEAGIRVGVFWFIGFPTELEEEARETWRYLTRQRERIAFSGYIGTFGLGDNVPVFRDPERFGVDIIVSPTGDPTFRRRDGRDWSPAHLHRTFSARNDLYLIESGAALLYSRRRKDLARALGARFHGGPPAFLRAGRSFPRLSFPEHNGVYRDPDGVGGRSFGYVGATRSIHPLEAAEVELIEAVRRGAWTEELLRRPDPLVQGRLERLVDYGVLETAPLAADEIAELDGRAAAPVAARAAAVFRRPR